MDNFCFYDREKNKDNEKKNDHPKPEFFFFHAPPVISPESKDKKEGRWKQPKKQNRNMVKKRTTVPTVASGKKHYLIPEKINNQPRVSFDNDEQKPGTSGK